MGGDESPRLVYSDAEACKDLKLIQTPRMRPTCFNDQESPLE